MHVPSRNPQRGGTSPMPGGPTAMQELHRKVLQAETDLHIAQETMVGVSRHLRQEDRHIAELDIRIRQAAARARAVLQAGREGRAYRAADELAQLENQRNTRIAGFLLLEDLMLHLRWMLDQAQTRVQVLRRSAETALAEWPGRDDDAEDMGELILLMAEALHLEDPFETRPDLVQQIRHQMAQDPLAHKPTGPGFDPKIRVTATDILARLKAQPQNPTDGVSSCP